MNDKLSFGKVFVLGFALFAMFFGAGNLIFPPALGIVTGTNWLISFLAFILADAGLAILALLFAGFLPLPGRLPEQHFPAAGQGHVLLADPL